jgi:3-oxoacyl-[acyl-carrier protein] reductase
MDLGITGRNALVCGSSQGLGFACAQTLLREGVNVTLNGRNSEKLEKAADALRGLGGEVRTIAADQSTVEGRKTIIETLGDLISSSTTMPGRLPVSSTIGTSTLYSAPSTRT